MFSVKGFAVLTFDVDLIRDSPPIEERAQLAAWRPSSPRLHAGPAKRSRHRGTLGYVY